MCSFVVCIRSLGGFIVNQLWEERTQELLSRDEDFRNIVEGLDEMFSTPLSEQTMDEIINGGKMVEMAQETLLQRIERNKKNVDELIEHKTLFIQHAKEYIEYINLQADSTDDIREERKHSETELLLWSKQKYHKEHIEKFEPIYKQDHYDIETWENWVNENLRHWFEYIACFEKYQDDQSTLERLFNN